MVPDSAAHPSGEAVREYVIVISAPPDKVMVICPVNVLTLLLHWLGVAPVPVMAPDEDTVPESNLMPLPSPPLAMVSIIFDNTPLATVIVNVPAPAVTPQPIQVLLQLPVYVPLNRLGIADAWADSTLSPEEFTAVTT